jgi:hypothetical protein
MEHKHFRGGAKVYVIDAFWGMYDSVTVIGQHRKSRKWMCLHAGQAPGESAAEAGLQPGGSGTDA